MKARFVKGVSKKSGREYFAIEITIAECVRKMIFLSDSEVALVRLTEGDNVFENIN